MKANTIIVFFLLSIMLILPSVSFAEDKVYTNADLKPEPPSYSNSNYRPLEPLLKSSDFNPSFDELHRYIEGKLTQVRIPEYKIYLTPLSPGMTTEEVKQRWGIRIRGGFHEEDDKKTWRVDTLNYEIGVSLYFNNNRLRGWKVYNQPRYDVSKDAKVIDYKDLMKGKSGSDIPVHPGNESVLGDEPVTVSISGCQTLQEALDGKPGNTNAVITVLRHGRTIEEICETLGQGCKACGEAPSQIGSNQRQ